LERNQQQDEESVALLLQHVSSKDLLDIAKYISRDPNCVQKIMVFMPPPPLEG
jgi:hypothetical protein